MFDANIIKAGLLGVNGWQQNNDPSGWQLTEMLTSESGIFYNSVHPLLTIDNLISICPEFDRIHATQGDINQAFTNWLKFKTEDAIIQTIQDWFDEKMSLSTANNLLGWDKLFTSTGNIENLETSTGKVVGFELVPKKSRSLITQVHAISLQFDTNQDIIINLFKTGTKIPFETKTVTYVGSGSVQWEDLTDWYLKGEGAYYIAYDQDFIAGNAINGVQDYTWNTRGLTSYPTGKYIAATSFNADAVNTELWDLKKNQYTVSTNYGLNLKLSTRCDYTDLIIEQKRLFAGAIAFKLGINLLRELAFNPESRVNRNESNIEYTQVLHGIDGDTQGRNDSTLQGKYKKTLSSISFDNSNIDKICLPCRKKGIRHSSIGGASY